MKITKYIEGVLALFGAFCASFLAAAVYYDIKSYDRKKAVRKAFNEGVARFDQEDLHYTNAFRDHQLAENTKRDPYKNVSRYVTVNQTRWFIESWDAPNGEYVLVRVHSDEEDRMRLTSDDLIRFGHYIY